MKALFAGLLGSLLAAQIQAGIQVKVSLQSDGGATGVDLPGAVVLLRPENGVSDVVPSPGTVTQINRQFTPYISVITQGSAVNFPNRDSTAHHVYSFSSAKSFELPLYKNEYPDPIVFDTPGIVILGCNIHDWMLSYIYVADTPYFAQVNEGSAVLANVPSGRYRASLWHPDLGQGDQLSHELVIEEETQPVDVVFMLPSALQIRQQPTPPEDSIDSDYAY